MFSVKNGVYNDKLGPWGPNNDGETSFRAQPSKNEFCDFNVLPPCSAGKTLTAFGIPRDKRFPALLSKFMALRRQIENKKGLLPCRF